MELEQLVRETEEVQRLRQELFNYHPCSSYDLREDIGELTTVPLKRDSDVSKAILLATNVIDGTDYVRAPWSKYWADRTFNIDFIEDEDLKEQIVMAHKYGSEKENFSDPRIQDAIQKKIAYERRLLGSLVLRIGENETRDVLRILKEEYVDELAFIRKERE